LVEACSHDDFTAWKLHLLGFSHVFVHFFFVPLVTLFCLVYRNKLQKARERDISEKIALGMPNTGAGTSSETQFDSRLFNTTKVTDEECLNLLIAIAYLFMVKPS
jgi:hypothetical protein